MEQSVKMVFRYAFVLFIKRNLTLKTHDTKMEGKRMENVKKYQRQYHMPPEKCTKWAQKEYVEKAPSWCSVDSYEPGAESGIFQASCKNWL